MNDESKQKPPVTGPLSYPGAAANGQAEPEDELVPRRPRCAPMSLACWQSWMR